MKVKVCDICSLEDAIVCLKEGVDFLGIHQIKGPLSDEKIKLCNEIRDTCPSLALVLVTQENDYLKLLDICKAFEWDFVQLHFDATPEEVKSFKELLKINGLTPKLIATFVIEKLQESSIRDMANVADFLLFDSCRRGGSGVAAKEQYYKKIPCIASGIPYFIAGGLTPQNVKQIIQWSQPYAVDVQSGVSFERPRHHEKNAKLIHDFVLEAIN